MRSFIAVPYHLGKRCVGAGKGPIRYAQLLSSLGESVEVIRIRHETHSEIDDVMEVNRAVASSVRESTSHGCIPIVLGGDCMVSLGIVAGMDAGCSIFWLDAHGDFNTPETSHTGYLDGMPLAILVGRCCRDLLMVRKPLSESSIFLIGTRALDPREKGALEGSDINVLGGLEDLKDLEGTRGMSAYLHIDLDVIDPVEAPGVDFRVPNGLSVKEVEQIIRGISSIADIRAVGITSYNPDLDVCDKTLNAGMGLISFLRDDG